METNPIISRVISTMVILLPTEAFAQSPQMPSEVAKTVRAFTGHWRLVGQDTEPGAKPAKVAVAIDCVPAALGVAVACKFAGQVEGAGKIEASTVIGYSPDEHVVRWMEISSTGEYHDHHGTWNGDTIVFDPLPYTYLGEKFTERLTVRFPSPKHFAMTAITETAKGTAKLEGTATRIKAGLR